MTRANVTIAILTILILVLCLFCYVGKPLIMGQDIPSSMANIAKDISKTDIGKNIYKHYLEQLMTFIQYKIGFWGNIKLEDQESVKAFLVVSLFAALIALVGSVCSIALFLINSARQLPEISKPKLVLTMVLVIVAGTLIRLMLAAVIYGNFDMNSFEIVADLVGKGGNVYAITPRYNYSPVWFTVLSALKHIQQITLPDAAFSFVIKSFLCGVDLLTLTVLLLIAGLLNLSLTRTAIFFYLNPVSFLITGYHAQFENLAMLMVLIGLFLYLRFTARPGLSRALLWLFATAGMIVKHNTFYELIICLHSSIKRYWIKLPLFVVSVIVFLSLFVPYWQTGSKGIINNVFKYGSDSGGYGITSLFTLPELKYPFILGLFIFPLFLKSRDIIAQCLLGTLFFLSFTTGLAIQYFLLPVALGVLRPSKFFLTYTIGASCFILGSQNDVFIPGFHLFQCNIVWVVAVCWFIAEMISDRGLLLQHQKNQAIMKS